MSEIQTKKILCIVQLPPPIHGASIMNSHVVNSEVIKNHFSMEVIDLKFAKSLNDLRKLSLLKLLKAFLYSYKIIIKVLTQKPDLVYYTLSPTGYAFYRDACYVFILKLLNQKIVFHLHGKGINKNVKDNLFKKYLYRRVFKNTYVICLSRSLVLDVIDVYKSIPYIVANGIQLDPKSGRTIHKTNNIPQILFLSNYLRTKGILVLVEALEILKDQGYVYNARFVGAPADLTVEMMEDIINVKKLTDFVKVIGPLYDDDKTKEFQMADIFVFPTFYKIEAFPLVILEAFQNELAVISTFEGGIPDIVVDNETGFLVEAQNAQMLADKIAILLKNEKLRIEMGKKGYKRFMSYYTLDHFNNNMNKTFHDILGIH